MACTPIRGAQPPGLETQHKHQDVNQSKCEEKKSDTNNPVLTKGAVSLIVGLTIVGISNVYLFQRKCWPILVVAWVICIAFLFLAFALVYVLVFVLRL